MTFGLWLSVHPTDMQRAFQLWWDPAYPTLRLEGIIANQVMPWELFRRPAVATVRDPDQTPYCTSSDDDLVADVLTREWDHELVLGALPPGT